MSGTLIRVIPKTLFDFGFVSPGGNDSIVVARAINVIPYDVAYLWVRLYRLHADSGTSMTIQVNGVLPSDETQDSFVDSSTTNLSVTSGSAPSLLKTSLTTSNALPPYLQIKIEGVQPASQTYLAAELSIDLLVRCCG
jgi:hypothetical protein